jgi:hypothetical protein
MSSEVSDQRPNFLVVHAHQADCTMPMNNKCDCPTAVYVRADLFSDVPAGGWGGDDTNWLEYRKYLRGERERPQGSPCALCGFPCDSTKTAIFMMDPRQVPDFRREAAGDRPQAHVFCAHTLRGAQLQHLEAEVCNLIKRIEKTVVLDEDVARSINTLRGLIRLEA